MRPLRSTSLVRVITPLLAIGVVVVSIVASSGRSDAAPSNDRAFHGYDSVGTNGFGATESWAGNLRLFTGHDQTGESFVGYCIQRGLNYPRGTDPQFADANSGFARVGDVPAQRGVSAADRATLAYALWRYGSTTDDRTAAAMFLLTHLLSADPDFGSTTLESTVLGPDWPAPAAVMARAHDILDESRARRGPWTIGVEVRPADGEAGGTVVAELAGPGGPISGIDVVLTIHVGGSDAIEVTLETGDDGRVAHAVDVADLAPLDLGDATDAVDPELLDHAVTLVDVSVTATVASTPGGYRVFHGRPGTQQLITDDGDGPPVSASTTDQITVPLPPPPTTTTTTTTTTTVPETTTTTTTTTTVPETTTTAPVTTTVPPTTAPPSVPPTTAAPIAPSPRPERPTRPVVSEPTLADTGVGVRLAAIGMLVLGSGVTLVSVARWIPPVPVARAGRRGGAHLRTPNRWWDRPGRRSGRASR